VQWWWGVVAPFISASIHIALTAFVVAATTFMLLLTDSVLAVSNSSTTPPFDVAVIATLIGFSFFLDLSVVLEAPFDPAKKVCRYPPLWPVAMPWDCMEQAQDILPSTVSSDAATKDPIDGNYSPLDLRS
jgi:hypothetical protein